MTSLSELGKREVDEELLQDALQDVTTDLDERLAATPALSPPQNDDRDYVSATEIRTDHTPDGCDLDNKQLKMFLALHTEIRTERPLKADGTPRMNRLLVHLGDWTKHQPAFREWYDAMRKPKRVSKEEVAKRTAALRTRKQARK